MSRHANSVSREEELEADLVFMASKLDGVLAATKDAAEELARLAKKHDNFLNRLRAKVRGAVSMAYLRRLVRVGSGELLPELAYGVGAAQPYLERLSVDDQRRVLHGIRWPVGGGDHRVRPLHDLRYEEARAAFKGGVLADDDTILRRMAEHNETTRRRAAHYRESQAEADRISKQNAELIATHGITISKGVVRIPRAMSLPWEALFDFLSRNAP